MNSLASHVAAIDSDISEARNQKLADDRRCG
jgi:hypothetical protein